MFSFIYCKIDFNFETQEIILREKLNEFVDILFDK